FLSGVLDSCKIVGVVYLSKFAMDKKEVAGILDEIGMMLELEGGNPFKSRAYANAARTLEGLSADLADLVKTGDISKIKGIGEALTQKITELVTTGRLK